MNLFGRMDMTFRSHSQAFCLLEVLIALLILATTFVAGHRWQVRTFAYQQFTYFHSHAALLLEGRISHAGQVAALSRVEQVLPQGQLQVNDDALIASWHTAVPLPELNCAPHRACLRIRTYG